MNAATAAVRGLRPLRIKVRRSRPRPGPTGNAPADLLFHQGNREQSANLCAAFSLLLEAEMGGNDNIGVIAVNVVAPRLAEGYDSVGKTNRFVLDGQVRRPFRTGIFSLPLVRGEFVDNRGLVRTGRYGRCNITLVQAANPLPHGRHHRALLGCGRRRRRESQCEEKKETFQRNAFSMFHGILLSFLALHFKARLTAVVRQTAPSVSRT